MAAANQDENEIDDDDMVRFVVVDAFCPCEAQLWQTTGDRKDTLLMFKVVGVFVFSVLIFLVSCSWLLLLLNLLSLHTRTTTMNHVHIAHTCTNEQGFMVGIASNLYLERQDFQYRPLEINYAVR